MTVPANPEPRKLGGGNLPRTTVEANQSKDCFTIRQFSDDDQDLIHICDWAAMKATVDQFQKEREGQDW